MTVSINGQTETFDTFERALLFAPRGAVLRMNGDMTEDVHILGNKVVGIDLAGHVLTGAGDHTVTVETGGMLTVVDSEGGGKVDCVTNGRAALFIMPGGLATLEGGEFVRSLEDSNANTWYVIQNQGSLYLSGAVVTGTSTKSSAVENGFDSARASDKAALDAQEPGYTAVCSVFGGCVTSGKIALKVDESAKATVAGGSLTSSGTAITAWSPIRITGGTLTATGTSSAVIVGDYDGHKGEAVITGGRLVAAAGVDPVKLIDNYSSNTTITVSGGSFSKAPKPEFLAVGLAVAESGGSFEVYACGWEMPEGGPCGIGLMGFRRLLLTSRNRVYEDGGLTLTGLGSFTPLVAVVNMTGGGMAYYDASAGRLHLYRASKEIAAGTEIPDLTVLMFGK